MSNYPNYAIGLNSTSEEESGYQDDFSDAGSQHSRSMHALRYFRFNITHPGLTHAQYLSLMATYTAGPRSVYTFQYHATSPQTTYSVKFIEPPLITDNHGDGVFTVNVKLRGSLD